ncbi:hypothetical protein FB451DRAFT_1554500 [Mycena latifolia]|nr:hypothetical protein FB451DRAFT_1554500 [Mycena latifolia]
MSSATSSSPTATDTSTAPPGGGGGGGALPSSTNYFYGFLIAFLCFLLSFGALHLMARRRRARLMRDFLLYGPDDAEGGGGASRIAQEEPLLWQPSYTTAEAPRWGEIMPLSTTLLTRAVPLNAEKSSTPPPPPRSLAAYLRSPFTRPHQEDPPTRTVTEALNISIMVRMPHPPETREEDVPEYQVGTISVPWTDEQAQTTS